MPYHVGTSAECPADKPHAAIKDSDGKVMGCHPSKEDAQRQIAAIYANEGASVGDVVDFAVSAPMAITGGYESMTDMSGTAWEGILVVENVETGDGREFAPNAITWAETPIPLRRNIEDSHGGNMQVTKTVLVGRIDQIWRNPDNPLEVRGRGVFDDQGEHGAEAARLVRGGFLKGISVDPDDIKNDDVELVFTSDAFHMPGKHNQKDHGGGGGGPHQVSQAEKDKAKKRLKEKYPGIKLAADDGEPDDGEPDDGGGDIMDLFKPPEKTVYHAGRLRAATLVDIPAFVEAQIWLTDTTAQTATPVAASAESAHFGQLMDRPWNAPTQEAALRADMTAGKIWQSFAHVSTGATNTTGARFMHHEIVDGLVGPANLTAVAAGMRTINAGRAATMSDGDRRAAYEHLAQHMRAAGLVPPQYEGEESLVAGGWPDRPPAEWFADPGFNEITPFTVTDEGRVFGHGAAWGTCHTSFPGVCTEPPAEGEHAYFRLGEVVCADGSRVPVGTITLGTGHAPVRGMTASRAAEHYDHTGTAIAYVASGEDDFGIWVAGAIRPGTPDGRVHELRASGALSGDWRRIGGQLRLVAFLAVNHPGFPVPRIQAHASGGRQMTLVASGVVTQDMRHTRTPGHDAAMLRLAKSIGRDPAARLDALKARVRGGTS